MTAAGDPRGAADLRALWIQTLGATQADDGWRGYSPDSTYKPAGSTDGDLPPTVRDATLSGVGTLGGTSGGLPATAPDTWSGRRTVAGQGAAGASAAQPSIPSFELLQEIGRGGMGVVFKARQRSLAREIAIKLIRPEHASDVSRSQFVAEALVNGLLDHPNIVPVHDLGTSDQGDAFLAMKLVGGTSWKDLLHPSTPAQRRLAEACDLDRHLEILDGVANAVGYAHSKGIVHRDLKPENVMVGAFGEVLVMDWGIAVDVRDRPEADARARHKSTVRSPAGTPSYMPPELAEGRGADIGPWTDTYLLGGILHEVLTGSPPHRGDTLLAVLMAASASKPPTFPPGVSAGIAGICARALSRAPAERFRTVAEFQAALRDHRRHRESEKIATSAAIALARAERGAPADEIERARRYGDYAEAIAGFRQALVLWSANANAQAGERSTRLAYARAALAAGDVALARAQVPERVEGDADFQALSGEIELVHARRARARVLAKRLRVGLIALTAVVVIGLSAGLWIVVQEQLRNARMIGPQQRLQASLEARLAALGRGAALSAAWLGDADPDAALLAHGSTGAGPTRIPAGSAEWLEAPEDARLLDWSSRSSRALLLAGPDVVLVRDLEPDSSGRKLALEIRPAGAPVVAACLSAPGTRAVTVGADGSAQSWSIGSGAEPLGSLDLGAVPDRVALDPDGRRLAVATSGGIALWEFGTSTAVGAPIAVEGRVARLVFEDGSLAVVGSDASGPFVVRVDPRSWTVVSRRRLSSGG